MKSESTVLRWVPI